MARARGCRPLPGPEPLVTWRGRFQLVLPRARKCGGRCGLRVCPVKPLATASGPGARMSPGPLLYAQEKPTGLIGLKYHPWPKDSLFKSPAWTSALNCRVVSSSLLSQGGPQFSSFPHPKPSPCFSPQLCSSHSFPISNGSSILPVAQAQTSTLRPKPRRYP